MPTAHSLVAPTQKMSDDTPYRPSGSQAVAPQSFPPENNRHVSHPPQMPAPTDMRAITTRPGAGAPPRSTPPQNQAFGSTPPAGHRMPPQQRVSSRAATTPAPAAPISQQRNRAQTPAESVAASPPPARRWGLILFVLLVDIGLAASGAWMLSQGLAS